MQYPGGKNGSGSWQHIVSEIPLCELYVEPFFGSGAVYAGLRPRSAVINDIDASVLPASAPAGTRVMCGDALQVLRSLEIAHRLDVVVYLDPPYLFETRKSGSQGLYRHEYGLRDDHLKLLSWALSARCYVLISGYASGLYSSMLEKWRVKSWQVTTRHGVAKEYLWMNYPVPAILYRPDYVGSNYVERQRLRRLRGVEKRY